jgi:hypothetical protein
LTREQARDWFLAVEVQLPEELADLRHRASIVAGLREVLTGRDVEQVLVETFPAEKLQETANWEISRFGIPFAPNPNGQHGPEGQFAIFPHSW